ncbi:Probable phosphopantothenoylcysteine decarboxylase [Linum perenne]
MNCAGNENRFLVPRPKGKGNPLFQTAESRKPRILLAASGSVAAIKFANICHSFSEWAEVKAVATKASLHFIDRATIPKDVVLYTDEDEWSTWSKLGDNVLHIELRRWADVMIIAPLSENYPWQDSWWIVRQLADLHCPSMGL